MAFVAKPIGHSCLWQTQNVLLLPGACRPQRAVGKRRRSNFRHALRSAKWTESRGFTRSGPRRAVVRHQRPATLWEGCRKEGIVAKPGSQIKGSKEFPSDG